MHPEVNHLDIIDITILTDFSGKTLLMISYNQPQLRNHAGPYIWLGVFAHPDDETSASAGTMIRWVDQGNKAYVITGTGGELGSLGSNNLVISRDELPAIRESELHRNLNMFGCHPPFMLRYKDQELINETTVILSDKILSIMQYVEPNIVVTFGPNGISGHSDHIAIHKATLHAFTEYSRHQKEPNDLALLYPSIRPELANLYSLDLGPEEKRIDIIIDIGPTIDKKISALRNYESQQDAQEIADQLSTRMTNKTGLGKQEETFSVSEYTYDKWKNMPVIQYLKNL